MMDKEAISVATAFKEWTGVYCRKGEQVDVFATETGFIVLKRMETGKKIIQEINNFTTL